MLFTSARNERARASRRAYERARLATVYKLKLFAADTHARLCFEVVRLSRNHAFGRPRSARKLCHEPDAQGNAQRFVFC